MPACFKIAPLAIPIAALAASPGAAQSESFRLSASVRLRYEAISGQARAGFDSDDDLVNLRTQIAADYGDGPVHLIGEIYDSRAWSAKAGTPLSTGEVNTLELVQAYVAADLGAPFGKSSTASLQVGRFMLNLGSRRLVAADDYRNTTNGYTGLRLDLGLPGAIRSTFIYTLPQQRLPDRLADLRTHKAEVDRESFDAVLWGGIASKTKAIGPASAELTFFHFGERDHPARPTRDRSLNTIGGRIFHDPKAGQLDYELEAFYQIGNASTSLADNAPRQSVSASFGHARVGYTFAHDWQPHLVLEVDRASGDKPGGVNSRFDTLFGMRRADFAPSGLYNAINRTNLMTVGLRLEATPSKSFDWFASWRPMWLASSTDSFATTNVRDSAGRSGDFAGHQIETRLRYWLIPQRLRLEFDGLVLSKGRFLRDAPNAQPGRWTRYGSFNLTANF